MDKNYVTEALDLIRGEGSQSLDLSDLVRDIRSKVEVRRVHEADMAKQCGQRAIAFQEQVAALDKLIAVIEWQPRELFT